MANIRVKRRLTGASGAPTSLNSAELAWQGVDKILYIGQGDNGSGVATSIPAIGGIGAFVGLNSNQIINGTKTFVLSPVIPTVASSDNSTNAASTAYVKSQGYITGNQTITYTGDATGSGTTSVALTLSNSGITAGTYTKLTVDSKGRATVGANLSASDIPTITSTKISDFDTRVRTSTLNQMGLPTADISLNGFRAINAADPISPGDLVNKQYADALTSGLDFKDSVVVATTANITLSGTQTIDGIALNVGDRVLVKDQTIGSENGIYTVSAGAWPRASDFDSSVEVTSGALCFVESGTLNGAQQWIMTTTGTIVIGTTSLVFTQFGAGKDFTAGDGLLLNGTIFSVDSISASRISVSAAGIDLASGIVTPGTYTSMTVDTYGRVTAGTNPTTLSGYGITDAQPLDATLTAFSGVIGSADSLPYFSGIDTFAQTTLTPFARTLLDDTSASVSRTTLGLGTMATQNASAVAITGGSITGADIDGGTF